MKPWLKKQWCIPPKENAEFVWKMEDVLDVYKRPYDPRCPQVCLDETSKQLIGETRTPVPAAPGRETRYDHEYRRNGVANLFMIFEPLGGRRHVKVTERRTKKDWAECVRGIVDEMYPDAERIVLVMDNLNTHTPASLYEAFPPEEAKRIADKLEIHVCAQARKLVGHGRDRTGHLGASVSGPSHRQRGGTDTRGRCLGSRAKRERGKGDLAIQHAGCTDQTKEAVPVIQRLTEH